MSLLTKIPRNATADYIIYKDGSNIIVVNGTTGKKELVNTDASTVIQYAIDNIPVQGGLVFIKEGTYTITTKITLCRNLMLAGAGGIYSGATDLVLDNGVDDDIIYYQPGSAEVSNITIRDISLNGNRTNQASGHGIHFGTNAGDCAFIRVGIKYVKEHAIYLQYAWGHMITNCIVEYCDGDAIRAAPGNEVKIIGNKLGIVGGYGVYTTGVRHKLVGNHIFSCGEAGAYLYSDHAVVAGNTFQDNAGATEDCQLFVRGNQMAVTGNTFDIGDNTSYAIVIRAAMRECVITGNTITGYTTAAVLDSGGRNLYNGLSISRAAPETELDNGTAESGTTGTLVDTDKAWVLDEWVGCMVEITAGAAAGDKRLIYDNTGTTLYCSPSFSTAIDNTSVYKIWDMWKFDPVEGAIVRDTTGNKTYIYADGGWREISAL